MPLPLPSGKKIHITYTRLEADYEMPSMEYAPDHYSLSFILHGDRNIITPTLQCVLHEGYVGTIAPLVYHKTLSASGEYYERILIKFAPDYIDPLIEKIGPYILERIFSTPSKYFEESVTKRIKNIFINMYEEYDKMLTEFGEQRLRLMLYELILLILEYGLDENAPADNTPISRPVLDAVFYMENNFMNNIGIDDVAAICGYSSAHFSRLFKAQLHISYSEYLNNIRLRHVKSMLISTDMSVTEIALEAGFKYPSNMTVLFKQTFGLTPLSFRKNGR